MDKLGERKSGWVDAPKEPVASKPKYIIPEGQPGVWLSPHRPTFVSDSIRSPFAVQEVVVGASPVRIKRSKPRGLTDGEIAAVRANYLRLTRRVR